MNFYEILKTKKLGRGSPDYWTQLFAEHVGGKGEWKIAELTGTLPITFRSNGTALINYRIFGTAEGAGVQTENLANFIPPSYTYEDFYVIKTLAQAQRKPNCILLDTGDYIIYANLTSDLWNIKAFTETGEVISDDRFSGESLIPHEPSQYWFKLTWKTGGSSYWYFIAKLNLSRGVAIHLQQPTWILICSNVVNATQFSITPGSTSPETYIPYGYKLPLMLTSRTESKDTDIYIGDSKLGAEEYVDYESGKIYRWADITGLSEPLCGIDTHIDSLDLSTGTLTRRIKKIVLTGNERFYKNDTSSTGYLYYAGMASRAIMRSPNLCNELPTKKTVSESDIGVNTVNDYFVIYVNFGAEIMNAQPSGNTINGLKEYLASRYAAGTPVTVWYVLANPETSTIPVPSGLTGTIEGYLIQDGTPTPEAPIYPTANGVKQLDGTYTIESAYIQTTDPPLPFPELETFKGTNTLNSTETLGEVTIKGQIKPQS